MDKNEIQGKTEQRAKTLLAIFAVLAVLCALLPYVAAQRYALFFTDDFSYCGKYDSSTSSSSVIKILGATITYWRDWQGTYSSLFLLILLNPLHIYSYALLRVELMSLTLGTVAAAFWLGSLFCGYFAIERKNSAFLCALVIMPLLLYRECTEISLWFTGAMIYLVPTLFLLLTFAFLLMGKKGKKLWYVLAALAAFMMAGGVLECVGFGMLMLLLLCLVERIREGRVNRGFCAVFLIGLAGALLNALAPGNFVRYGGKNTVALSASILSSLFNSGRAVLQELGWVFGSTGFIAFLVLAFLLGLSLRRRLDKRCLALALAGLALAPAVTIFPVVLGYNWSGGGFPNRCLFLLDASLYFSMVMIAVLLGCRLSTVRLQKSGKAICAVVAVAIAVSPALYSIPPSQYPPVEIAKNLQNGSIKEYSETWRSIFDYLYECGGGDVNIQEPGLPRVAGCPNVFISTSPEHWDNYSIARYFGLDSVWIYSAEP